MRTLLIALLLFAPATLAATTPKLTQKAPSPIQVLVRRSDPVVGTWAHYHYSILNVSPRNVTSLRIGLDPIRKRGELRKPAKPKRAPILPAFQAPRGWSGRIVLDPSGKRAYVEWRAEPDAELASAGFTATLDRAESDYETCHWAVEAGGRTYTGSLHPEPGADGVLGRGSPDSLQLIVLDVVRGRPIDSPNPRDSTLPRSACPLLLAMLSDPDYDQHQDRILWLLGFVGTKAETPLLENYVLEKHKGQIEDRQLAAVFSALFSLGRISNRDSGALEFLLRGTNPDFYRGIGYSTPGRDQARLRLLLSQITINSLGFSLDSRAGQSLAELERKPYHPSQAGNVTDAIRYRTKLIQEREAGLRKLRATVPLRGKP